MSKSTLKFVLITFLITLPFILIINQLETGSIFGYTTPSTSHTALTPPIPWAELKQIGIFAIIFASFLLCWLAVCFILDTRYDCTIDHEPLDTQHKPHTTWKDELLNQPSPNPRKTRVIP